MLKFKNTRIIILFLALLLVGFIYRFILKSFVLQWLIYDMDYYRIISEALLEGRTVGDIYGKTFGYPTFLAGIFLLFGKNNFVAAKMVQICLDLLSSCLLFGVSLKLFGKKTAWITFIMSLFSPITAVYTGLVLPEVLTIFLIVLILFLSTRDTFLKRFYMWLAFGIVSGFLVFTRFQFYYFILILPVLFSFLFMKGWRKLVYILVIYVCVILTSAYTLYANYTLFHLFSLNPPKTLIWPKLYLALEGYRDPELLNDLGKVSPSYYQVLTAYLGSAQQKDYATIDLLNAQYKQAFLNKLSTKWPVFFQTIIRNMVLLWDKRLFAPYSDPFYPSDVWVYRIFNIGLISISFLGLFNYLKKIGRKSLHNPFVLLTIALFIYMTGMFSLVSNESRHTIAYYPIFYIWGSYGIMILQRSRKTSL